MNGANEEPASTPPLAPPPDLGSLTPEQLAELASNSKVRGSVWAEVHRRLKDDPRKASFLTFRWLLPADYEDKADAFDGLIGCCWGATKKRLPSGLFLRGYAETYCGKRERLDGSIAQPAGGVSEETREAIKDALAACLHNLRTLSAPEIVLTALHGGFHTDADVGNALHQRVRQLAFWDRQKQQESPYVFKYGNDLESQDEEGDAITLFEIVPDNPGSRTNVYNAVLKIITQEKAQIVEELGEKGWTAFEEILELIDNEAVCLAETGNCQNERDFERSLTDVFERVYGVKERQARTHKSRFLATVKRIVKTVLRKTLGRGDIRKASASEYSPPVVPMKVILQTAGMPVISRLLCFDDKLGEFGDGWGDNRSSVGRDVPPDEWQEMKARA
jgi:hypothetical protein